MKTRPKNSVVRYNSSNAVMAQSKAAIRESFPDLDDLELKVKFVEIHYGKDLADGCRSKSN